MPSFILVDRLVPNKSTSSTITEKCMLTVDQISSAEPVYSFSFYRGNQQLTKIIFKQGQEWVVLGSVQELHHALTVTRGLL